MPVRLKDQYRTAPFSLGSVAQTLADYAPNFDGTSASSQLFQGTISSNADPYTSAFTGVFDADPSRTGTIAVTMDPHTAEFGGGDPYDLSGLTNIAWTPVWATPPNTSGAPIEVSNISGLQSAVGNSGVVINIAAGTYDGNVTITGNDIDIVMSNSATILGDVIFNSANQRIRWTGGNCGTPADGCRFQIEGGGTHSDYLFDDFFLDGRMEVTGTGTNTERVGFVNSTITGDPRSQFASANDGVLLLFQGAGNVNTHVDWIWANVRCDSRSANNFICRFMETERQLIYECALGMGAETTSNAIPGLRFNENCDVGHVQSSLIGRFIYARLSDAGDDANFLNFWFEGCDQYTRGNSTGLQWSTSLPQNAPNTGTVNNCTIHSDVGSVGQAFTIDNALVAGPDGNNLIQSYSVLPDVSTYGATRP